MKIFLIPFWLGAFSFAASFLIGALIGEQAFKGFPSWFTHWLVRTSLTLGGAIFLMGVCRSLFVAVTKANRK